MTDAEINRLIAEKVMGWSNAGDLRDDRYCDECWSPSTSIADAIEALVTWKKQIKSRYAEILIVSAVKVQLFRVDFDRHTLVTKVGECEADTMQRAISLALVEAVKETT